MISPNGMKAARNISSVTLSSKPPAMSTSSSNWNDRAAPTGFENKWNEFHKNCGMFGEGKRQCTNI
eukprot:6183633-Pleurochrysis_carterae.AAC.2